MKQFALTSVSPGIDGENMAQQSTTETQRQMKCLRQSIPKILWRQTEYCIYDEENILKMSLEKKRLADVIMEEGEEDDEHQGGKGRSKGGKKKKKTSSSFLSAHEAKRLLFDALSQQIKR